MADFNPNEHLIQLKSKQGDQDYLPVKWRLVWFRSVHPHGTIDTEEVGVDLDRVVEAEAYAWNATTRRSEKVIKQAKGYARFRAIATDGKGGRATGTKAENAANFADFVEKSETGAIGRALAALGFGTQFTDEEFNEGERLADSPVERAPTPTSATPTSPVNTAASQGSGSTPAPVQAKATEQQIASIGKLCKAVGMSEPENLAQMAYFDAKNLQDALTAEYKQQRIEQARQRVNALDMIYDDVKRDALKKRVEDKDLTIADIGMILKVIAQYEQRVSSKAS